LLLEDIDLIGNSKDGEDSKSSHNIRLICHLRSILDEFNSSTLVIGATTCHPMNVHESLKRPGRLTHEIFIQVPSLPERLEMIKALDPELQCEQCLEIAQVTQGYLASDLNQLVVHLSQGSDFQGFEVSFTLDQSFWIQIRNRYRSSQSSILEPNRWTSRRQRKTTSSHHVANQVSRHVQDTRSQKTKRCTCPWSSRMWQNNVSSSNGINVWSDIFLHIRRRNLLALRRGLRKVIGTGVPQGKVGRSLSTIH